MKKVSAVGSLLKNGGTKALAKGRLEGTGRAIDKLVRDLHPQLKTTAGLPVPLPTRMTDGSNWEALAPYHRVVAGFYELGLIAEMRRVIEAGGEVRPRVTGFPVLRTDHPDLRYLQKSAPASSIVPLFEEEQFLIVTIPELEIRALAECLKRHCGDGGLAELIRRLGSNGVRTELARRISGLEEVVFTNQWRDGTKEYKVCDAVARAALNTSLVVSDDLNLRNGWSRTNTELRIRRRQCKSLRRSGRFLKWHPGSISTCPTT